MTDLFAEIRFLSTEEGGRRTPVQSGYHPNHNFDRTDGELNDAVHNYLDRDSVMPGQTVVAEMALFAPERNIGRLYVGMHFTVQEGNRVVARGVIKKIHNPKLQRSS